MTAKNPSADGMVGPFWIVEDADQPVIIAVTVALGDAEPYGDMLTVDTGHLQHWSALARRGAAALRKAAIPTAPVWSEYEEWPRGRVLFDTKQQCFIVRADRQLHRPEFLHLIAQRFRLDMATLRVLADDHYRSVRQLRLPAPPRKPQP